MTCPHFSISICSHYNKRSGTRESTVAGAAYISDTCCRKESGAGFRRQIPRTGADSTQARHI